MDLLRSDKSSATTLAILKRWKPVLETKPVQHEKFFKPTKQKSLKALIHLPRECWHYSSNHYRVLLREQINDIVRDARQCLIVSYGCRLFLSDSPIHRTSLPRKAVSTSDDRQCILENNSQQVGEQFYYLV